jgi:hypothetical protein
MAYQVGVDLGTTWTAVAVCRSGGPTGPQVGLEVIQIQQQRRGGQVGLGQLPRLERWRMRRDGSWKGWPNETAYAIMALRAGGAPAGLKQSLAWLREVQNPDGGWGESPGSYHDIRLKGRGPSTAAQTAWSILTLLTLGDRNSTAVARGLRYLCAQQQPDGSWHDEHWTGTGFPRVFYLRYHLYPTHFPVLALATYRAAKRGRPATDRLSPAIAGGGSTE